MFRFFLALSFVFVMSFSWGCFCKQDKDCQDPDGYGITEIYLQVPMSHDLFVGGRSSFRALFSAKGKTLECLTFLPDLKENCVGTFPSKGVDLTRSYYNAGQHIYLASKFFYKELRLFIQHDGVTLFDGVIDFSKKPNEWKRGVDQDTCAFCFYEGTAYITSTID